MSWFVSYQKLENIYKQNPFDYQTALKVLEKEAKEQPVGKDSTLTELPSFTEICIVQVEDAKLKPSTVRPRLGKMFNSRVREGPVGDVNRCKEDNGNCQPCQTTQLGSERGTPKDLLFTLALRCCILAP